jgi:hypothetical protein
MFLIYNGSFAQLLSSNLQHGASNSVTLRHFKVNSGPQLISCLRHDCCRTANRLNILNDWVLFLPQSILTAFLIYEIFIICFFNRLLRNKTALVQAATSTWGRQVSMMQRYSVLLGNWSRSFLFNQLLCNGRGHIGINEEIVFHQLYINLSLQPITLLCTSTPRLVCVWKIPNLFNRVLLARWLCSTECLWN